MKTPPLLLSCLSVLSIVSCGLPEIHKAPEILTAGEVLGPDSENLRDVTQFKPVMVAHARTQTKNNG